MFGIVNNALGKMVREQYGEDSWHLARKHAEVETDVFLRGENYPDEVSYRLMGSIAEITQVPMDDLLSDFGKFWYQFTIDEGFRDLLDSAGDTLWEFLFNMNHIHAQLAFVFPGMKAPVFKYSDVTPESMVLRYYSTRKGFALVVKGSIEKTAERFDTKIEITRLERTEDGADYDSFLIKKI